MTTPRIAPDLPSLLRELRRSSGHTQADVAAAVGKTRALVSQWEGGLVEPRLDDLRVVLDLLGATDDERLAVLSREAPAAAS